MTAEQATANGGGRHSYMLSMIPLDQLEVGDQPRKDWDSEEAVEQQDGLTDSIRQMGLLQPILTTIDPMTGHQRLVAGERRIRAMKAAGEVSTPALVVNAKDEADIRLMQLIENVQKRSLSPIEEGDGYLEVMEARGWSGAQLARSLGLPSEYVYNRVKVVRHPVLRQALERGLIKATPAAIIAQLDETFQEPLLQRLRDGERLDSSDAEAARRQQKEQGVIKPSRNMPGFLEPDLTDRRKNVVALHDGGMAFSEIANHLGLPKTTVGRDYAAGLRLLNRAPSPAPHPGAWRLQARFLRDGGLGTTAITRQIGVSEQTVRDYLATDEGRRPVETDELEALDAASATDEPDADEPQGGLVYTFDDRDHIVRETMDAPAPILDMTAPPTHTVTTEETTARTPNAARSPVPMVNQPSPLPAPEPPPPARPLRQFAIAEMSALEWNRLDAIAAVIGEQGWCGWEVRRQLRAERYGDRS